MATPMLIPAPILVIARMQAATLDAWRNFGFTMFGTMKHLCDGSQSVLPNCGRKRWHDVAPDGADLLGRYGHRCHDVDAERAV